MRAVTHDLVWGVKLHRRNYARKTCLRESPATRRALEPRRWIPTRLAGAVRRASRAVLVPGVDDVARFEEPARGDRGRAALVVAPATSTRFAPSSASPCGRRRSPAAPGRQHRARRRARYRRPIRRPSCCRPSGCAAPVTIDVDDATATVARRHPPVRAQRGRRRARTPAADRPRRRPGDRRDDRHQHRRQPGAPLRPDAPLRARRRGRRRRRRRVGVRLARRRCARTAAASTRRSSPIGSGGTLGVITGAVVDLVAAAPIDADVVAGRRRHRAA